MNEPISYHEGEFPPKTLEWERLIPLIGPANAAVARYDGILSAIQNASVLLSPLTTQEAVLSSRIEGTQATMGEVLEFEARGNLEELSPERNADIREVLNYRRAMKKAVGMLTDLPLCQRVIKEAHRVLLHGVRGQYRDPGEYRRIPNWIGPPGCTIENARFIPISSEKLPEAMNEWEKYIHTIETPDKLIQLSILHAEIEALHPFLDGNGRIGRMFVPLFMYSQKLINSPMFYISAYLEAKRDEYYERLLAVSRDGDWTGWCLFFLNGIKSQAEENQRKATGILSLYNEMKNRIVYLTHSQYAILALDWIFEHPIFKSSDFVKTSKIPKPTATRILNSLKKAKILEIWAEKRGRIASILAYSDLLNLAEGHNTF